MDPRLLSTGVDEDVLVHSVVVPYVVRRVLEMELDRAGVRVERQRGVGVEVVPRTRLRVPVGCRIANAPVDQVELGIVRARHPGGAASILPGLAAPGIVARLAGTRHGVGTPDL